MRYSHFLHFTPRAGGSRTGASPVSVAENVAADSLTTGINSSTSSLTSTTVTKGLLLNASTLPVNTTSGRLKTFFPPCFFLGTTWNLSKLVSPLHVLVLSTKYKNGVTCALG